MKRIKVAISAKDIAYTALAVALITVCAWISVPVGHVPFTLQTFAVAFVGAVLGFKRGVAAVFVYLLMGLMGIPVFSKFAAGPSALFGPTGGYLFGFLFLALLPALFKGIPVKNSWARAAVFYCAALLGTAVCYAFGTVWFMLVFHCGFGYAFSLCVLPFLAPDFFKLALAALLAARLEKFAA